MYLTVGEGRHVDELRFSILSAARFLREDSDWRIVIYADRSEPFEGLPVEIIPTSEETFSEWVGPHRYVWRAKIQVIAQTLAAPDTERCVYVDGDTYFLRSPAELIARVAPGKSVMHVREGRPPAPEVAAVDHVLATYRPLDLSGRPWVFSADRDSWNAGVVGLHREDAALCREVEHLTDQLLEHGFGRHSHTSEQLAFAVCLAQRTQLSESQDVVMHYWRSDLREPFAPVLRQTLSDPTLSQDERFQRIWAARPRETPVRRAKARTKRIARRFGVRL